MQIKVLIFPVFYTMKALAGIPSRMLKSFIFQMAKKCTFFANICDTFSKNTIDVVVNIYEVERTVFFDS